MPARRRECRRDPGVLSRPDGPLQGAGHVKFVDGFPTTVTGEIQKFLMRQQMIDELGLSLQETA
jgi:hypothetical protein